MELREAIDKLFEMTDEQRFVVFGTKEVGVVLNSNYTDAIIKNIENFYTKPKYGDIYVHNTDSEDKCVFLGEDCEGKCWLLFNGICLPQEYSKFNFEKNYTKTGENVEDKLSGLFK